MDFQMNWKNYEWFDQFWRYKCFGKIQNIKQNVYKYRQNLPFDFVKSLWNVGKWQRRLRMAFSRFTIDSIVCLFRLFFHCGIFGFSSRREHTHTHRVTHREEHTLRNLSSSSEDRKMRTTCHHEIKFASRTATAVSSLAGGWTAASQYHGTGRLRSAASAKVIWNSHR